MKQQKPASADAPRATAQTNFPAYADPLVSEAITQSAALESDADAEKLHKLRVSLRRLRTLLWAYRPLLDEDFDTQQRAILKFLASAAGNTRDWDILIKLVEENGDADLLEAFRRNREETAERSRETLSNANLKQVLRDAISETNRELNTANTRMALDRFARKRVAAAQKQLKKRIKLAAHAKRSNYAAFHDVRKAGKKVRYLIEFFEPSLSDKQRKGLKKLKRLQKRFGALNDVVASRALLTSNRASLPESDAAGHALRALKKEQARRMKAAAKLL